MPIRWKDSIGGCWAWLVLLCVQAAYTAEAEKKITYQDHIQPIFREKCFACHNPDQKKGGLDLTSYSAAMRGGSSGEVIEPGNPQDSYLYQLVTHQSEPYMPPMSDPIPQAMQDLIKAWIEGGALETSSSKPLASKKPTAKLAISGPVLERPADVAMPGHLELEPVLATAVPGTVKALATSPWAPLVAVAGQKQVLLYHTRSLDLLGVLAFPEGTPYVLRFSRSGDLLLAGGGHNAASGRVVVWDVRSGERQLEVGDELDVVLAADISSDQTLIALGGPQKVVRTYSTADGQKLYELRKHTDWILSAEFSPDGVLLATGDRAGNLFVWEAATGRDYLTLKGHTAAITGLSWRSDSNVLASCSEDGTVRLWEVENGNTIKAWSAHGGGVSSVEFLRDGRLVTTGRDRVTKLWNQEGAALKAFDAFDDIGVSVTACDETNRVIAGDWRGTLRVWDAESGQLVGALVANPPSLAQRLEAAQHVVAERRAESAKLQTAAQEAAAAWKKLADELATTQAARDKSASEQQALRQKIEQDSAKLQQVKGEFTRWMDTRETLRAVLPKLDQAARLAAEAAKNSGSDEALAQLAASAAKLLKERQDLLNTAETELAVRGKAIEQLEKELKESTARVSQLDDSLKNLAAAIEALTAKVKLAEEQKQAAEMVAAAAAARLAEAEAQVARWTTEIAFVDTMRKLREKRAALLDQAESLAGRIATLSEGIGPQEQRLAESTAALAALEAEDQKIRAVLQEATTQRNAAAEAKKQADNTVATTQQRVEQLAQAVTAINDAAAKSAVAFEKTQDQEVQAVVQQLQKVAQQKQAELDKARQELKTAQDKAAEAANALASAEQAYQTCVKNAEMSAAKVAEFRKQHEQLSAKVQAAQQELANLRAEHERLLQQANQVVQEIRAARG